MLNLLAGFVLFVSAGIFLSAVVCRAAGIYYNHTPSFPVGFYKIIDAPVGKGAYVSFCPPQAKVFDMAMAKYTIDTGNCPGGYGMLLKRVLAQRGDTVSIDAAGQMLPQASPNAHAGGNRAGGYEYAILSLHRFARATLYRFAQTYRPFAMPNCTSTHIPRVDVAKPANETVRVA